MRWIWLDRFISFESGKAARAVKNLSSAEDVFAQHFPRYPVMPAALMIEGLAQTGGILVGEANDFREKVILAKILSARFQREVFPGEQLVYDVKILNLRAEGASIEGKILVDDIIVAEAEIFFAHLDQNRAQQVFGEGNFVFTGELGRLLGLARFTAAKNSTAAATTTPEA
jgi:3-hydroxyacyl-[acyl-carrier-protein] dehydratase